MCSQNIGDFEGVADVGLTAAAALALVGLLGVKIGPLDAVDLRRLQIGGEPVSQGLKCLHCR